MYRAFSETLGLGPTNFQLSTPFSDWNWSLAPNGETNPSQQSFLNTMPDWSRIGRFANGSSFSDAYQVWLSTLRPTDQLIRSARKAFRDKKFYTTIYSNTTGSIQTPGYTAIDDYATWMNQHPPDVTNPITITWEVPGLSDHLESVEISDANGKQSLPLPLSAPNEPFIEIISKKHDSQSENASVGNTDIQFTLTFGAWGSVEITPLPWYSQGTVRAKIRNPEAYRSGYSPNKSRHGDPAWVLGDGGIMPLRATRMLVARDPKLKVTHSSGDLSPENLNALLADSDSFRIGPIRSTHLKTSFPIIFGVEIEEF